MRMGGIRVCAAFQRAKPLCGKPGTEQDTDKHTVEQWRLTARHGHGGTYLAEVCPECLRAAGLGSSGSPSPKSVLGPKDLVRLAHAVAAGEEGLSPRFHALGRFTRLKVLGLVVVEPAGDVGRADASRLVRPRRVWATNAGRHTLAESAGRLARLRA
jgi:hypothetical protein